MFEFYWKRLPESSDLFFCLEPERIGIQNNAEAEDERADIKILEVRKNTIKVHRYKKVVHPTYDSKTKNYKTETNISPKDRNKNPMVLQYCNKKPVITVTTFPYELAYNPYHAFCMFSPDLKYYFDWDANRNVFTVINTETGTPELDSIFDT